MLNRRSGSDSSDLNNSQSLRETRIEQRRNYTDACQEKGANEDGYRQGTNAMYEEVFGGKPRGTRDQWPDDDQRKIAVTENIAANRVRSLPDPTPNDSQDDCNDRVTAASRQGAKDASEYISDQTENGNWWSRLFG